MEELNRKQAELKALEDQEMERTLESAWSDNEGDEGEGDDDDRPLSEISRQKKRLQEEVEELKQGMASEVLNAGQGPDVADIYLGAGVEAEPRPAVSKKQSSGLKRGRPSGSGTSEIGFDQIDEELLSWMSELL